MAEAVAPYPNATIVVQDYYIYPSTADNLADTSLLLVVSFSISSNVNSRSVVMTSCLEYSDLVAANVANLFPLPWGNANTTARDKLIRLAFEKIKPHVDVWHAKMAGVIIPDEVFTYTPL